jgi:hypothetical protein
MHSRGAVAAAALVLAVCMPAQGHEGCAHGQKAIQRPSKSAHPMSDRRSLRDPSSIRIEFDYGRVDANDQPPEQQEYVKAIVDRAGGWLSSVLKIRYPSGPWNLTFSSDGDDGLPDCGEIFTVPQQYINIGVPADLVVFVLSESCPEGTAAYASHCQIDVETERPTFGYIQMCTATFQPKDTAAEIQEDLHVAVHEITHILGMSSSLFPYFRDDDNEKRTSLRCPETYPDVPDCNCSSNATWVDKDGDGCDLYDSLDQYCLIAASYADSEGVDASDVCCACKDCPEETGLLYNGAPIHRYKYPYDQIGWCCADWSSGLPPFRCEAEFWEPLVNESVVEVVNTTTAGLDFEGRKQVFIKTPKVVEWGRKHFGCETLTGVELEDDGGGGTTGSHWEMRTLLNDYMVGINIYSLYPTVKSVFTLALLEDSGWYWADYSKADLALKWGHLAGCDFLRSCDVDMPWSAPGFCSNKVSAAPEAEECASDLSWADSTGDDCEFYNEQPWWCDQAELFAVGGVDASLACCACREGSVGYVPLQCSFDRSAVGYCGRGGSLTNYMEGCGVVRPVFWCSGGQAVVDPKCQGASCQGQTFSDTSSCFDTTLFLEGWPAVAAPKVACYENRCLLTPAGVYVLEIMDPVGRWHICDEPYKAFSVPGYNGSIFCPPDAEQMCKPPNYGFQKSVDKLDLAFTSNASMTPTTSTPTASAPSTPDPAPTSTSAARSTTLTAIASTPSPPPQPPALPPAPPKPDPSQKVPVLQGITTSRHFVSITITMPYSKAEFDEAKQHKYKAAVSSAAGAPAESVVLVAIGEINRRDGSVDGGKKIDVETEVLSVCPAPSLASTSFAPAPVYKCPNLPRGF